MTEEKSKATFSMQRRQFFTGRLRARDRKTSSSDISSIPSFRPPWAIPESLFDHACTHCGDCISACPTQILSFGSGRLPIIDFMLGECTFCGKCEAACKANALTKIGNQYAWSLTIAISEKCLSVQRITCRSCGDMCESEAIRFQLEIGGKATPHVNTQKCTGCGACIAPCPVNAIQINRKAA